MIRLFYSDLNGGVDLNYVKDQLASFPGSLQERIKKFKRSRDIHASIVGKLLVTELGKTFGFNKLLEEIQYTAYNKPYFKNRLNFSISHSGKYVMCAASDTVRVGLDVEEIKPIEINDFRPQFNKEEWSSIITDRNAIDKFYESWTKKEAIAKAEGKGLSIPLAKISLNSVCPFVGENSVRWVVREIEIDLNYKCALAMQESFSKIKLERTQVSFPRLSTSGVFAKNYVELI